MLHKLFFLGESDRRFKHLTVALDAARCIWTCHYIESWVYLQFHMYPHQLFHSRSPERQIYCVLPVEKKPTEEWTVSLMVKKKTQGQLIY